MSRSSPTQSKLVIVMVGLPGRGKSYIARKLDSFLNFRSIRSKVFNVGANRRAELRGVQDFTFFDQSNEEAVAIRERLAFETLESLTQWFAEDGGVAIFDATNSSKQRRLRVREELSKHDLPILFVESVCDDAQLVLTNVQWKAQRSPDYQGWDLAEATQDLLRRITMYEQAYEPLDDELFNEEPNSYVKLMNLQSKVICARLRGPLMNSLASFLMALHLERRPIWLSRPGHCAGNSDVRWMDDLVANSEEPRSLPERSAMAAHLSSEGEDYARRLAAFVTSQCEARAWRRPEDTGFSEPLRVLCSTLPRAHETVQFLNASVETYSALNTLDKVCIPKTLLNNHRACAMARWPQVIWTDPLETGKPIRWVHLGLAHCVTVDYTAGGW